MTTLETLCALAALILFLFAYIFRRAEKRRRERDEAIERRYF